MDKLDRLVKLAVALGALLIGGGVFYHYVVYLPRLEEQKVAQAMQEKEAAAQRAEREERSRQLFYAACKSDARKGYEANWAAACHAVARIRTKSLKDCLANKAIMENPYLGERHCKANYGDIDDSPDCTLPTARSDALNKTYHEAEEKCLAEAKLGL